MNVLFAVALLAGYMVFMVKLLSRTEAAQKRDPWLYVDTLYVPIWADDHEVFTSDPLMRDRVYKVEISGTFPYWEFGLFRRNADAAYTTDEHGNLSIRHRGLKIAGGAVAQGKLEGWTENRVGHVYSYLLTGCGQRLSVRLSCPDDGWHPQLFHRESPGPLMVRFELQPLGTPTVAERIARRAQAQAEEEASLKRAKELAAEREESARLAARQAQQAQQKQAEAESHRQRLAQRVRALSIKVRAQENFLDDEFAEYFVDKYLDQILSDWRYQWRAEYENLMTDRELVESLEADAPEVLEWHKQRLAMIRQAERRDVMPESVVEAPSWMDSPLAVNRRTKPQIQRTIEELYRLRDRHGTLLEQQVTAQRPSELQSELDAIVRLTNFQLKYLTRYGIFAEAPEEAEEQLKELLPEELTFTPAYYEDLMVRIKTGERLSRQPLRDHLNELHKESIILQMQRKVAVKSKKAEERESLDERLVAVRREAADLQGFLESLGEKVVFEDYREREQSFTEKFKKLQDEKSEVIELLRKQGDDGSIPNVEALFAENVAKLFEPDEASYT